MRQWHVPPNLMCQQHITAEHRELHMFVAHLHSGKSYVGYVLRTESTPPLFVTSTLIARHDLLAAHLPGHTTPLTRDDLPRWAARNQSVEEYYNGDAHLELVSRCPDCAHRLAVYLTNHRGRMERYENILQVGRKAYHSRTSTERDIPRGPRTAPVRLQPTSQPYEGLAEAGNLEF